MRRAPEAFRPAPESPLAAAALALAAFAPAFAAYAATLHPGLPAGDSGELVTVAATFGVAHPPGYPLWTLLAGLWARAIPFGNVAWRLNLFSAVGMAAAAAVLAAAVRRLTGSTVAALVAAWAFAAAAPAWKYALVAEVFALNALLGALVLLALAHAVTARPGGRARPAAAIALLGALALSHHHTLLLLAIPAWCAAFALAARDPAPVTAQTRVLPLSSAWALAGLAPLLWLTIAARDPHALVWGDATTIRGFLTLLLRAEYGTFRLDAEASGLTADTNHALLFARALPAGFGPAPLVLAAIGLPAAWSRSRPLAWALAGFAALQALFFSRVGFPSGVAWLRGVVERFYVLPLLVLAFLAGLGAAWLLARAGRNRAAAFAVAALLLAAVVVPPALSRPREVSQRGNAFAATLGRGILASVPPNGVLFVQGDLLHNACEYLTRVEGERPDVVVLDQELMTYAWYVRRVRAAHPDVLPRFGAAGVVHLRGGRSVEGVVVRRADGTADVLVEDGQATVAAGEVVAFVAAPPESLFHASRAGFRSSALLEESDDRYSGLPGTRNLLWLDHLEGRRPAAFLGAKDESFALRYRMANVAFASVAHRAGAAPSVADETARTLDVLARVPLDPYFRDYDPLAFELAERWRFAAVATRAALLLCRPEGAAAAAANPAGHDRLLAFARRFETLDPERDPSCLRAIGFLRLFDPVFRDPAAARRDLERYAASGGAAASDPEVKAALAGLGAAGPGR